MQELVDAGSDGLVILPFLASDTARMIETTARDVLPHVHARAYQSVS